MKEIFEEMESLVGTGGLNYENLYEEAMKNLEKMQCENKYLHESARELRQESEILKAKLSMVELIFGG